MNKKNPHCTGYCDKQAQQLNELYAMIDDLIPAHMIGNKRVIEVSAVNYWRLNDTARKYAEEK